MTVLVAWLIFATLGCVPRSAAGPECGVSECCVQECVTVSAPNKFCRLIRGFLGYFFYVNRMDEGRQRGVRRVLDVVGGWTGLITNANFIPFTF